MINYELRFAQDMLNDHLKPRTNNPKSNFHEYRTS